MLSAIYELLIALLIGMNAGQLSWISTGVASYYDDGPGLYAAVHSFTWGDEPYLATVCAMPGSAPCVEVLVRDHCQCYFGTEDERLIDLSPEAFIEVAGSLAPGLKDVSVQRTEPEPAPKARPTLPPTDTESGDG